MHLQSHSTAPDGDTPSDWHWARYGVIRLHACVNVGVHQQHVRECFVCLPLTDQVYLTANWAAATEKLPIQTLFFHQRPLISLHIQAQSLASKQVEGTVELCSNNIVPAALHDMSLKILYGHERKRHWISDAVGSPREWRVGDHVPLVLRDFVPLDSSVGLPVFIQAASNIDAAPESSGGCPLHGSDHGTDRLPSLL